MPVRKSRSALSERTSQDERAAQPDRWVRRVVTDPVGGTCLAFLVAVIAVAVLAPWIAPYDPIVNNLSNTLAAPSDAHWLGTDELGRDVLSRLMHGARTSLLASSLATSVAVAVGLPCGLLAGFRGGRADRLIMRAADSLLALPGVIIILAVIAVFGTGLVPAMTTLGVLLAPTILRIVRAATLDVRQELFVDAAKVLGLPGTTIIRRHLAPHVLPPFIVQTSLALGLALLVEAGLSFIGLGSQPPAPSWGAMLSRATTYMGHSPTLVFPSGVMITVTVLALNLFGDVIRDNIGRGINLPSPPPAVNPTTNRQLEEETTSEPAGEALLVIRDLGIGFSGGRGGTVEVVTGVSFNIDHGETVGLVGESGCGKSVTARATLGLVPAPGRVTSGSILLHGEELVGLPERALRRIRGVKVGMIFQDPTSSLDPAFTVGDQISEGIRAHNRIGRQDARRRAVELLDQVGIADAARRVRAYPHEFSGGMAQRVMIATALAGNPDLLVADEPTTALDVTVQADILELLRSLQAARGMSILFVTHDLGVVADLCDRVIVMYAGQIVETAATDDMFAQPHHPYSEALLASMLRNEPRSGRLARIPGAVPAPQDWPHGCRFAARCAYVIDDCRAAPVELAPTATGRARCIRSDELAQARAGGPS